MSRLIEQFAKFVHDEYYLLYFIIGLIVFILVLFLISFYDSQGRSSYISKGSSRRQTNDENIKDCIPSTSSKPKDNALNNEKTSPFNEAGHINPINNKDTARQIKTNENQHQIQQEKNVDGTVRTEINFDYSYNDPISESPLPKYEYLETANSGQFRRLLLSDEKSFFRTWVDNGTRLFEFHGNVEKALANFNAIFDDVCEIEGKQNGATQINNIVPGTLTSQLKVDKRAKIKLT